MQTSARNTFSGTVTNVTKGAVNAEIELTLASGGKSSPASRTGA